MLTLSSLRKAEGEEEEEEGDGEGEGVDWADECQIYNWHLVPRDLRT
jgi:hypothetical protein